MFYFCNYCNKHIPDKDRARHRYNCIRKRKVECSNVPSNNIPTSSGHENELQPKNYVNEVKKNEDCIVEYSSNNKTIDSIINTNCSIQHFTNEQIYLSVLEYTIEQQHRLQMNYENMQLELSETNKKIKEIIFTQDTIIESLIKSERNKISKFID